MTRVLLPPTGHVASLSTIKEGIKTNKREKERKTELRNLDSLKHKLCSGVMGEAVMFRGPPRSGQERTGTFQPSRFRLLPKWEDPAATQSLSSRRGQGKAAGYMRGITSLCTKHGGRPCAALGPLKDWSEGRGNQARGQGKEALPWSPAGLGHLCPWQ